MSLYPSTVTLNSRYTCIANEYWRPSEKALRSSNGIRCFPDAVSRQNCRADSTQPRGARLQFNKPSFVELPIIVPSPTVGPVSTHHHTGLRSSSSRRTFDACKWQRPIARSHPIENRLTYRALTMQRYQNGHRISQIRFLDFALLHPICEVGRRGFVALRDELLGGSVGEQRREFRTVLVQLAFTGAFRP